MNMNKAFYPLLISIILAGGIFIGYKIQDRNAAKSGMYSSSDGNSKLENILTLASATFSLAFSTFSAGVLQLVMVAARPIVTKSATTVDFFIMKY